MGLAKNLGLLVPRVEVMTVQEDLYVVDRYDRIRDEKGKLYRLHQEDFCQAIGFMPENKYEEEGGPSLSDCFSLIDRFSTNPALDRKQMLDWIIFNYLIHNADGHAKNLSLILSPDEIRLAPFYDLICTGIYGGINEKLAMKIGGENRLQWLMQRHWERLAEGIGIRTKFVLQNVMKMATQIEDAAHKLASEQQKKWGPTSIVEQIQKIIAKQVKHTKSAIG
jgi:serine/threonine-protein kinase HipA